MRGQKAILKCFDSKGNLVMRGTVAELATMLGVTKQVIYNDCSRGLPCKNHRLEFDGSANGRQCITAFKQEWDATCAMVREALTKKQAH
jgi:hypothetical protein